MFGNSLNDGVTYEWVENLNQVAGRYIHSTQKIQLNKYIVNTAEKLPMVLSHECCHAVAFNLHGREGNPPGGHGFAFFNACHRFAQTLPHLPPITVYHNYLVPRICFITCKCALSKHYSELYQPLFCRRCGRRFTEEDKVYRKVRLSKFQYQLSFYFLKVFIVNFTDKSLTY